MSEATVTEAMIEVGEVFLVWGTKGEYSDRTEWPVAVYQTRKAAEQAVNALKEAARSLYAIYRRREDELEDAGDRNGETLLETTPEGREFAALHDQEQLKLAPGDYDFENMDFTCTPVPMRTAEQAPPADGGEGDSYTVGQYVFNYLRAFLGIAEIDASLCKLVIELPDQETVKKLVTTLQRDARGPSGSAARIGNNQGLWQGVEYEFTVTRSFRQPPAPNKLVEAVRRCRSVIEQYNQDEDWDRGDFNLRDVELLINAALAETKATVPVDEENCEECRSTGIIERVGGYDRPCDACHGTGYSTLPQPPASGELVEALEQIVKIAEGSGFDPEQAVSEMETCAATALAKHKAAVPVDEEGQA